MASRAKTDNSHGGVKRAIRLAALKRLESPVVLETHAGLGNMRESCYSGLPGILCEKNEGRAECLAEKFPEVPVYCGDSIKVAYPDDIGPVVPNLIDVDPFGDPWPHLTALMNAPWLPDRAVFVVTDGLIQSVRLSNQWIKGSLRPAYEKLGQTSIFKSYDKAVASALEFYAAEAGLTAEFFAFRWFPNVCYYAFETERIDKKRLKRSA